MLTVGLCARQPLQICCGGETAKTKWIFSAVLCRNHEYGLLFDY